MEGTYYFGDELRWNLGWENPNQAGAFIATLIPFLWAIFEILGRRGGRGGSGGRSPWIPWGFAFGSILGETALWFLLCKTYSRGALVAIAGAACFHLLFQWRVPQGRRHRAIAAEFGLRGVTVLILLWGTGFIHRISPEFAAQDASVGNRLSLWRGGLRMVSEAPFFGWGTDQSGVQFMHWFQSLDADERYAGMVNSYLHVAVERGLSVLAPVLAVLMGFVLLGVMMWGAGSGGRLAGADSSEEESLSGAHPDGATRRWTGALALAASSSLVAFLGANVFSTLWIFPHLWWVPAVAAFSILLFVFFSHDLGNGVVALGRATLAGGASAVGVSVMIFVLGTSIGDDLDIEFAKRDGLWLRNSSTRETNASVLVLPDPLVLGENYGKAVRRLVRDERFPPRRLFVPFPDESGAFASSLRGADLEGIDMVIACGRHCTTDFSGFDGVRILLLHPTRPPNDIDVDALPGPKRVDILLPAIDLSGQSRRWERVARRQGWTLTVNSGVALDVRAVWPDCLESWYRAARVLGVRGREEADAPLLRLDPSKTKTKTKTKTKARRGDVVPIHPDAAAAFRALREMGKSPRRTCRNERVYYRGTPKMPRFVKDLEAAGIPETDERGRRMKLHGLRATLATFLTSSNVPPRVSMELLRHKDPRLTMKTYTDASKLPLVAAFAEMPSVESSLISSLKTGKFCPSVTENGKTPESGECESDGVSGSERTGLTNIDQAWPSGERAEGVGFEPTEPFGSAVFKTAAIDHSATPPGNSDRRVRAGESYVARRGLANLRFCPPGGRPRVVLAFGSGVLLPLRGESGQDRCNRPLCHPSR